MANVRRLGALSCVLSLLGCQGAILDPPRRVDPRAHLFELDRGRTQLLPFSTRLARLAAVTAREPSDPLFEAIRNQRVALGGYDHAIGVLPDDAWSATRIALWIRLVDPICTSPEMRARYPELHDDPSALLEAAYGRAADPRDVEDLDTSDLADPDRIVCLAILGSAEFSLR